jgi:hypothetical protein
MFNHHFFHPRGKDRLEAFLQEGREGLVLVTDPPFGGMVQALAESFSKIEELWRAEIRRGKRFLHILTLGLPADSFVFVSLHVSAKYFIAIFVNWYHPQSLH